MRIREKYQHTFWARVSAKAITDIETSIQYEINTAIENNGNESVESTLTKIIDYIEKEWAKQYLNNTLCSLVPICLTAYVVSRFISNSAYILAPVYLALSGIGLIVSYALSFGSVIQKLDNVLTHREKSDYSISLSFLLNGWKVRENSYRADSAHLQQLLVLDCLKEHLQQIKSKVRHSQIFCKQ